MVYVSAIGIIICFALLIFASFKNINTVLVAALGAGIVGLFGGNGFINVLTGPYMESFASFVQTWIIIFALGGLLGRLYEKSGAAWRIGSVLVEKAGSSLALIAIILFGVILVYAGMNAPVALFIVYPLARVVFPKSKIPWSLAPGVAGLATVTVGLTMPGSLGVINLVAANGMGVSTMAAPVEGIVASIFLLGVGILYIMWQAKKGKDTLAFDTPDNYLCDTEKINDAEMEKTAPNFIISIIPILVTLVLVDIVRIHMILGFGIGCFVALILFNKYTNDKIKVVSSGFQDGMIPCILVAAVAGLGGAISATPVFDVMRNAIMNLPIGGLVKVAMSTTLISGICASGSGGLQMTLNLLGEEFMTLGYPAEIIARVAAIASGGLDSMPWNGTVVMILALSGVGIKKGYKHVFVLTCILPILASFVAAATYGLIH